MNSVLGWEIWSGCGWKEAHASKRGDVRYADQIFKLLIFPPPIETMFIQYTSGNYKLET